MRTEGRTDRQEADIKNLTFSFRNIVNASENSHFCTNKAMHTYTGDILLELITIIMFDISKNVLVSQQL
jgi:hypothetical protein